MELVGRRGRLSEPEVQYLMLQLISGVRYLHEQNVIHRDLKLGNIFIGDSLNLKIGDFGSATRLQSKGERKRTLRGTPNYIAPEILGRSRQGHSFEVDVWSIGCILYTLLIGVPPFETRSIDLTYHKIKHGTFSFPSDVQISPEARSLIQRILHPDPTRRPTLDQVRYDEFFTLVPPPCEITDEFLHSTPPRLTQAAYLRRAEQARRQARAGNAPGTENISPNEQRDIDMVDEVTRKLEAVHIDDRPSAPYTNAHSKPSSQHDSNNHNAQNNVRHPQNPQQRPTHARKNSAPNHFNFADAQRLQQQQQARQKESGEASGAPLSEITNQTGEAVPNANRANAAQRRKGVLLSPKFGKPSRVRVPQPKRASQTQQQHAAAAGAAAASSSSQQPQNQQQQPQSRRPQTHAQAAAAAAPRQHGGARPRIPRYPSAATDGARNDRVVHHADVHMKTLKSMHEQIQASFVQKKARKPGAARVPQEDIQKDFAPPLWVLTWCDYSEKYGMGYLLSNGSVGVYYNDSSKIVSCHKRERMDYIEHINEGDPQTGARERRTNFTTSNYPASDPGFAKKVTLLRHFDQFLNKDHDRDLCEPIRPDQEMPYVQRWYNTRQAKLFALSNQTVQVNFNDRSEVIITPASGAHPCMVTYTDRDGDQISCTWAAALKHEQPDLAKRLKYANGLLKMFIDSIERDAGHGGGSHSVNRHTENPQQPVEPGEPMEH